MASSRFLLRCTKPRILVNIISQQFRPHRSLSTAVAQSHHNDHHRNHQYLSRGDYLNSWKPPKEAQLRRDYAMKVKAVRKEYIQEMELMRLEKQRKDEIKKEALRIEDEERKAAVKKAKAAERQLAEEEFRQTLVSAFSIVFINYKGI
ncbi:hypothetical protein L1987_67310 [Smallanthus sonchifolius]|uniref:Uncharacterized protein n=1 Tax=Smallanthus sonchifolius TaxID=185202 RepID=A0ACB9B4B0_9ASTR|nr:hypothetical protein L1987_67310 [Smallanthus sonchifolius]